ncbi:hypothetical protein COEREDRAFT_81821, partial [Coemansia reversa NRRL 1564]
MSGSKELSFDSFVPPGGAPAPAINASGTDAKSQGVEWVCDTCELKNIGTATKCIVCDAQKPVNPQLASSITSVFQPQAVSGVSAVNSYVSGEESEDSVSDSGSSVYSSEYSESSVTGSIDGLSESDSDSEQDDMVPIQDEKAPTAKLDALESDNEDSGEEESGSEGESDRDNVDLSSLIDAEVVAGSTGKEADSIKISEHEDASAALHDDKAAVADLTDEETENKTSSDNDNVGLAQPRAVVSDNESVVEEENYEVNLDANVPELVQPETQTSNVETSPSELEDKDAGGAEQDEEHKSYAAALKEAILDRVDSDSVDSVPIGAEDENISDKHLAASGTEQKSMSNCEEFESDVAAIVDNSDQYEDGDATTAVRAAATLENHDLDDFVHVSQLVSQTDDKEDDDVSSTSASICKANKVSSEDSGQGVPPVSYEPNKSDNVEAGVKTTPEEPVTVSASETADSAENREGTQKELAPVPTEDASVGNQNAIDKFDVGRLQILSGKASVEYIVKQALDASYCDDSESESGSGIPKPEAPESVAAYGSEPAAADKAKPVKADELDMNVAAPAVDSSAEDFLRNDRSPKPAALEKSLTGSSGDFVMLSHPENSFSGSASSSASISSDENTTGGFDMGDIAVGIDHASVGTASDIQQSEAIESPVISIGSDSDYDSDASLPQKESPKVVAATAEPLSKGSNDAKSFFKAGILGSFGNKSSLGKSTFGSSSAFGGNGASGVQNVSGSSLPNAFATSSTSSIPAFGSKLDKPVFGVASMSSLGAKSAASGSPAQSASFANLGKKMPTGFGQHSSGSQNPFAVLRENSGSPDSMVSNDSKSGAFAQGGGGGAFGRAFGLSKPKSTEKTVANSDPIRSIIQGDDSDAAVSDGDS